MSEASRASSAAPLSDRSLQVVCLGFALWTLCSPVGVALGGSLAGVVGLFAVTGIVAIVAGRRFAADDSQESAEATPPQSAAATRAQQATWALACACAALATPFAGPLVLWALLLAVLAAAAWLWLLPTAADAPAPAAASRAHELWLLALAAACALYALVVHRPDADDSFYINMAVDAVDHPELPLLARDTLHGRFDLPIHYPTYRLHSFELLNGAVAWLTGIPAIRVFHFGAAAVGAFLVPLAYAALFRRLTPRHWLWATLAVVVVLAAPGETHRWYGNFAFVRMWQGKGIFLFVFLPLIWLAGLRFALQPDGRRFVALAAAQIAALGCTSAALWAAPIASLVAMSAALRPNARGLRTLGVGALASLYLVAAGLLVKSSMSASIPELVDSFAPGDRLQDALLRGFGDARLYLFGIGSWFVAWAAAPLGSLAQRFAIAAPLAVTLVLFNPFLDAFVRSHVTGPSYWRALWAMPAPLLMALVLVAPLRLESRIGAHGARAATIAALVVFAVAVPRNAGFSESNAAWLGLPELKVGAAHRWAEGLTRIAPRQRVVAPASVSTWLPTFHDHAYPMAVRVYLKPLRERIGDLAFRDRHVMTQFVEGDLSHPRAAAIFERGLDLYDVQAACLRSGPNIETARDILRRAGFSKRIQGTGMEIWARL
jgi:hypothetical protein